MKRRQPIGCLKFCLFRWRSGRSNCARQTNDTPCVYGQQIKCNALLHFRLSIFFLPLLYFCPSTIVKELTKRTYGLLWFHTWPMLLTAIWTWSTLILEFRIMNDLWTDLCFFRFFSLLSFQFAWDIFVASISFIHMFHTVSVLGIAVRM